MRLMSWNFMSQVISHHGICRMRYIEKYGEGLITRAISKLLNDKDAQLFENAYLRFIWEF